MEAGVRQQPNHQAKAQQKLIKFNVKNNQQGNLASGVMENHKLQTTLATTISSNKKKQIKKSEQISRQPQLLKLKKYRQVLVNLNTNKKQTQQIKKFTQSRDEKHNSNDKQNNKKSKIRKDQQTLIISPSKSVNSKIKQNQINIQTQTKQFHNSMSAQYLLSEIVLTNKQTQRLKLYFKYISERLYGYPKNSTFDDVRNIYSTINMTEWMIFCKNMGIVDKFKQFSTVSIDTNAVKLLCYIYKKYEDIDRRMNFQGFGLAIRETIMRIFDNQPELKSTNQQGSKQIKKLMIQQLLDWLCLSNKKKFITRLRQMGVMCSQQVYIFPQQTLRTEKNQKYPKSFGKKSKYPKQRASVNICSSNPLHSSTETNSPLRNAKIYKEGPTIKIYKSNLQRRQSRLMHNLVISDLKKVLPSEETKAALNKLIIHDDKYLKEYLMRQESIKKGVIDKLQRNSRTKSCYKKIKI